MIHGSTDDQTSACVSFGNVVLLSGLAKSAEMSWPRNAGEVHNVFGCQTRRNKIRHPIEISEAPMSTIHGLM